MISANIDDLSNGRVPFCDAKYSIKLSANTDYKIVVPAEVPAGSCSNPDRIKLVAVFKYNKSNTGAGDDSIWVVVNKSTTALLAANMLPTAPVAGQLFNVSLSELEPSYLKVYSGDVIHVMSALTGGVVSVNFYFNG